MKCSASLINCISMVREKIEISNSKNKQQNALTGILNTMFCEHAMRPVADAANDLYVTRGVLVDGVFRFRLVITMPSLLVPLAHFAPFFEVRVPWDFLLSIQCGAKYLMGLRVTGSSGASSVSSGRANHGHRLGDIRGQ